MVTPEKINTLICCNFIAWMLFSTIYSFYILAFKQQYFPHLVIDEPEIKLFQRERGGIRRITNHPRNLTKATLSKLV